MMEQEESSGHQLDLASGSGCSEGTGTSLPERSGERGCFAGFEMGHAWNMWLCYTEKATEARHRPDRQYTACDKHKKQCRPNEPKPNSNATHPRKRRNNPTSSYTPSRIKSTYTL